MNTTSGLPAVEELRPLTACEVDFVSGASGSISLPDINITTVVDVGPIGVLTQVATAIGTDAKAINKADMAQASWLGVGALLSAWKQG